MIKTVSNILESLLFHLFLLVHLRVEKLFISRLLFVTSNPSDFLLREKSCSSTIKMDFHHFAFITAKRIYFVQDPRTYSPRPADPRLLPIPTSWGRVADPNLN